jgi:hypothetical protein
MATNSQGYQINKNPIAQSFFIDVSSGIYITKLDLFFSSKDGSFPVSVQIRTMENGTPTEDIIPGTHVSLGGASVNTSTNATVATTFNFIEPVYLTGLRDYAIIVNADSPDYKIYIAEINEFLIGSTEKRVDRQPVLGSLFYSQNGVTWTPSQDKDLTFKLYQAKFNKTSGQIVLHNASVPRELLLTNPLTVASGDATVTVKHLNHGLQVGQDIGITGAVDVGGISASNINGTRTITAVDWTGYQFEAGENADSDVIGGGSSILTSKNIPFTSLYPHVQSILPNNTNMNTWARFTSGKSFAGTETAFQKEELYSPIEANATNHANNTPFLLAYDSAEITELGANIKSLDVAYPLITSDSNVSPMLDLQRASMTLINNIIDRPDSVASSGFNAQFNYVSETSPNGGSSAAKHIMEPVVLEQDAVGLKILLSANRPQQSDFQVYYRTATGDEILSDKNWVLQAEDTNNPADENQTIYREYRYLPGGIGGNLSAFTQFQVKVVMRSTNTSRIPIIKDLRVIALSV